MSSRWLLAGAFGAVVVVRMIAVRVGRAAGIAGPALRASPGSAGSPVRGGRDRGHACGCGSSQGGTVVPAALLARKAAE